MFKYNKKNVVTVTIPIKVELYSHRKIEVNVQYWIEQTTISLFWGFFVFNDVEIQNNLDKLLKEAQYRAVSLKEIDALTTKVKIAECELKLQYLDFWYSI